MRSALRGKTISDVEVTNIALHGFWLLVDNRESFLPYGDFPWFRDATVGQIVNIERRGPDHLHWPDLDVDLTLDSIEHPNRYPLVSKARPNQRVQRTAAPVTSLAAASRLQAGRQGQERKERGNSRRKRPVGPTLRAARGRR